MEFRVLRRQVGLAKRIEAFLDYVSESGIIFKLGIAAYLRGDLDAFGDKAKQIAKIEHLGDELRRDIERNLYMKTLIPESRGDVLELLESMDAVLDKFKGVFFQFEIQEPVIPSEFNDDFNELCSHVVQTVETLVLSVRAFFKDSAAVADHLHKVSAWESEADYVNTRLQKGIYRSSVLDLARKSQLRNFARRIDSIADMAEDVADRLSIYVIKRTL